ncbi:MAG: hypothetical protein ABR540_00135 [Acidimicrobiales bacterium]
MAQFVNEYPTPACIPRRDIQASHRERVAGATAFDTRSVLAAGMPPSPVDPRIVSSAHGALRHILLCYPAYADGELSLAATYGELIGRLPATCQITILAHPRVRDDLARIVGRQRPKAPPTIVEAPDFLAFSVWAEDGYVAVNDVGSNPQRTFLVEPFSFPRFGDSMIAELVAEATDLQATQAPLYFQGGNVLVGDDFVLIGSDYLTNTLETWRDSQPVVAGAGPLARQARDLFVRTFDRTRRLHFVGVARPIAADLLADRRFHQDGAQWTEEVGPGAGTQQPIFHIDMFLSLAGRNPDDGRYRVLVGSPPEAARILGQTVPDHAVPRAFDEVARQLTGLGFEVIRTPLPRVYVDDPRTRTRRWYFATSNNCLVEITDTSKRVWLPTYGHGPWEALRATDDANRAIWEELGFEVTQLGDFHYFAQNLGALHCIKKYLARG